MALPPLTLAQIKPHLSNIVHKELCTVCDDAMLGQLSQPEGLNRIVQGNPSNIRMGWHHDQERQITQIFLRIYRKEQVDAYTFSAFQDPDLGPVKRLDYLIIMKPHVSTYLDQIVNQQKAKEIFSCLAGASHTEEIHFEVQPGQIHKPQENLETVRKFFENSPTMLPSPFHEALFPQEPESPKPPRKAEGVPSSSNETAYLYIAGGLLLILGAAYIAKQYFGKSKQHH